MIIKYCVPFVLCCLFLFEINSIMFVLQELPMLNEVGLIRYHAQRALDCYITMIHYTEMNRNLNKNCFESSKQFVKDFDKYDTTKTLISLYNENEYTTNIKLNIDSYLPNCMIHNTCKNVFDNEHFITTQLYLKDAIVGNVTSLLDYKVASLIDVYIMEFSFLFLFLFGTIGYVLFYYKSVKHKNNLKTENAVINQLCHELRTSLTPIEMYTRELMGSTNIDFEQKQFINNYILASVRQHNYILVSRLDFEKMMNKEYELKLENVDIVQLLKTYILETKHLIILSNKPLEIQLHTSKESLYVQLDKLVIYYILTNILRNSVKYSNDGMITVMLCVNSTIQIQVTDEGIGISADMQRKLNGRNNSVIYNQKESDSYGLGILFTKKLVSLLESGAFSIESNGESKGTTSTITFDAITADTIYIKERNENLSEKIVICITDDCPIVRNVMKRTLKSVFTDVHILQFNNGEQLLDHWFDESYTYVHVLDEHMHSTGGKLLGSEVSNILKSCTTMHYTISMSGNDTVSQNNFDIIWNKPPPPNDQIELQIRNLIRSSLSL